MLSLLSAMAAPEGGAASSSGSMMTTFVTFGLIIVIFYFLIIRPQKKRDKETKEMLASVKKGDKVVSIGGIHGTVVVVKDTTIVVKVDDNTRLEFSRSAISSIVNRKAEPASSKKKAPVETVAAPAKEATEEAVVEPKAPPATKKNKAKAKKEATDATVVETAPENDTKK